MTSTNSTILGNVLESLKHLSINDRDVPDYWLRHPDFKRNKNESWNQEFHRLCVSRRWTFGDKRYAKELRACFLSHLADQASPGCDSDSGSGDGSDFGSDTLSNSGSSTQLDGEGIIIGKLIKWQALCAEVDIEPGNSITQCKKSLKQVNINLVDLVRARRTGQSIPQFASRGKLIVYTRETKKYFPLAKAKKDRYLKIFLKTNVRGQ